MANFIHFRLQPQHKSVWHAAAPFDIESRANPQGSGIPLSGSDHEESGAFSDSKIDKVKGKKEECN